MNFNIRKYLAEVFSATPNEGTDKIYEFSFNSVRVFVSFRQNNDLMLVSTVDGSNSPMVKHNGFIPTSFEDADALFRDKIGLRQPEDARLPNNIS